MADKLVKKLRYKIWRFLIIIIPLYFLIIPYYLISGYYSGILPIMLFILVIGFIFMKVYPFLTIDAGSLLKITTIFHDIHMKNDEIFITNKKDIEEMFLKDFENIKQIATTKKWKKIKTTTHIVIAYELISNILATNKADIISRSEFYHKKINILRIAKNQRKYKIIIKKRKKKRINNEVKYVIDTSKVEEKELVKMLRKKDYYDIKIDVPLLINKNRVSINEC